MGLSEAMLDRRVTSWRKRLLCRLLGHPRWFARSFYHDQCVRCGLIIPDKE